MCFSGEGKSADKDKPKRDEEGHKGEESCVEVVMANITVNDGICRVFTRVGNT